MCSYCEPNGWNRKCCSIHGAGTPVYISISVHDPNGGDYPYTTLDLCEECFLEYGVQSAIDCNGQCGVEGDN